MKAALSFLTNITMAVLAGLIAWSAWEYSRPFLGQILPQPFRGFILELRFLVSFVCVVAVLSVAEYLIGRFGRKLDSGD